MAVKDDLIASGLSEAQAVTVIAVDAGTATAADLVAAGFSSVQATEILAEETTADSGLLTEAGLWTGTQVPAVKAAIAVTEV